MFHRDIRQRKLLYEEMVETVSRVIQENKLLKEGVPILENATAWFSRMARYVLWADWFIKTVVSHPDCSLSRPEGRLLSQIYISPHARLQPHARTRVV
ncbi:MAG: hypothetical protein OXC80_06040 [Gammaproteobacteria bacterium]|nr:hypothetical protein [Gammaproteobacteria bacterium]